MIGCTGRRWTMVVMSRRFGMSFDAWLWMFDWV
jgi:hypothetical protein